MRTVSTRVSLVGVLAMALLVVWLATGWPSLRATSAAPVRQSSGPSHMLKVNGHGEAAVPPDMATLSVGVQTKESTAQDAISRNAGKMTAVIDAVKGQGIPESRIKTSNLSLYEDREHGQYVASNGVTVRVDDVSKVGTVLDAAVAAGANNAWGVNFGLKDPSAARALALKAAVADARKRADAVSQPLKITITDVSSVSEEGYSSPPIMYGVASAPGPAAATPVQAGQLSVSADITVVYAFAPSAP